jgi:hypothetical protein
MHFNYVKGAAVNQRSKVARFEQPIGAEKHVPGNTGTETKPYTITLRFSPPAEQTYLLSMRWLRWGYMCVRETGEEEMKKGSGQLR